MIGDYGLSDANCEAHVANLVEKFSSKVRPLEFIMTMGDNNYWSGHCDSMYQNIGRYYGHYFTPGERCVDPRWKVQRNMFYPTLGNHDWDTFSHDYVNLPYFQYFEYLRDFEPSIGGGMFYKKTVADGLIEIFSLNSNLGRPQSTDEEKRLHNVMMEWVKGALMNSTATYRIVYFHHPARTTARIDPPSPHMDLNFTQYRASMVMTGHEHVYERLQINQAPYIINGLGGHPWRYTIHDCDIEPGSKVRYNDSHGALFAAVTETEIEFCFYSTKGVVIDHFIEYPVFD
jgi:hypothetical protein